MNKIILLVLIALAGAIPAKPKPKPKPKIAMMGAFPANPKPKEDADPLAVLMKLLKEIEDGQDTPVEITIPYCPKGVFITGTASYILNQTIIDALETSCPEGLVGGDCEDYNSDLRNCMVKRIPKIMKKIRKNIEYIKPAQSIRSSYYINGPFNYHYFIQQTYGFIAGIWGLQNYEGAN